MRDPNTCTQCDGVCTGVCKEKPSFSCGGQGCNCGNTHITIIDGMASISHNS
jgi:hypothetical protein